MSKTPIRDRAKRLWQIKASRERLFFHEHKGASWEFKVLDLLRDIRGLLVFIAFLLFVISLRG